MILATVDKSYPKEFVEYLKGVARLNFAKLFDSNRIRSVVESLRLYDYNISNNTLPLMLLSAIDTAVVVDELNVFVLKIDPVLKINGIRLNTLCQMVNDGSLTELSRYPIFTSIRMYIQENLENLYDAYQMGVII